MKRFLFAIALFMCGVLGYAQEAEIALYGGPYDDEGAQIIDLLDGYLIVGTTASVNDGDTDIYVIRLNDDLSIAWTRTLGTNSPEQGRSVCLTNNGEFLVLGHTTQGGLGGYDLVLYRLAADGSTIWQRNYGTSDWDFATKIVKGVSMYYIAATTHGFSPGNARQWLFRINDNGDFIDESTYDVLAEAEAHDLVWHNNALYLIGTRQYEGQNEGGILRKLSPSGEVLWEYVQDSTAFQGRAVAVGDFGVTASFAKNNPVQNNTWDFFMAYFDENGTELSNAWLPTPDVSNQVVQAVANVSDLNIHVASTDFYGFGGLSTYVLRLNSMGIFQSAIVLGGERDDEPRDILVDSQDRILILGYSRSTGNPYADVWLVRLPDPNVLGSYEFNDVNYVETMPFTAIDEQIETIDFLPYPNPAGEVIHIPAEAREVSLVGVLGKVLTPEVNNGVVDLSSIPAGSYILQFGLNQAVYRHRIAVK
jgi:hypothetical protein